jgi:aminopeptidase
VIERYADTIIRSCLRLAPGDTLFLTGQHAHRELLVALADAGYRAGAALVDLDYQDPLLRAARVRHAADEHLGPMTDWHKRRLRARLKATSGMVSVLGEGEPNALDGLPPERIAADSQRAFAQVPWYLRGIMAERRRWVGAAWPTDAWAAKAYPELPPERGRGQLLADILSFSRLGPEDPEAAWERHVEAIMARAETLTELGLERLELRGPGTELTVRLVPGTRWVGGRDLTAHGQLIAPNIPTEENYTSPDARSTEGVFRCSRPLAFQGRLIHGIAGEFRGGSLVRLQAANAADRDFLAAFLETDEGARRLGEVALVDATSRIGRAQRVYANTLLDENAAAHVAFGFGFESARERGRRGVNRSNLHLDVMIGTDDFEATGIATGGRRVPLIADGLWQL